MAKVLVVDHERRIRSWLTVSLGKCGYDVVEAAGGQSALQTASRQKIDLILLDDALPIMDGWMVLTKLKEAHIRLPLIPPTKSYQSEQRSAITVFAGEERRCPS